MRSCTVLLAASVLALAVGSASANDIWDYTFTGPGDSGSGTFTTTGGSSTHIVTGVTGVTDGNTVTALIPVGGFFGNDNAMYSPAPYLDYYGVSWGAGGIDYNIFWQGGGYYLYNSASHTGSGPAGSDPLTSFITTETATPGLWDFSFTGLSDSGTGMFNTSGGPAFFTVTGVTGVTDGNAITSLFSIGGFADNDNIINSTAPLPSIGGIAWVSGGIEYNIFSYRGEYYIYNSLSDTGPGPLGSDLLTSFDATLVATPEPATWALMLAGFAGIGAALRSRRSRQAGSALA